MSEQNTGKTVHYTLDPSNPPQLTEEQSSRLASIRDEDIDFSDLPDQSGRGGWRSGWSSGGPAGRLRREALKENILLVDLDVVTFFKQNGKDSAEQMNAVLREYVEAQRKMAS